MIDEIHVLKPIRFTHVRRNEIDCKIPVKGSTGASIAMTTGEGRLGVAVEGHRQQRAAMILKDLTGGYIDALTQVILELASDTTPPTEEQMASIADTMAFNAGANNHYAIAGTYLDALAQYIDFMISEIGYSPEGAVQFVMDKYILPLAEGDNAVVATYVAAKLTAQAPIPVNVEPDQPEMPEPGSGGTTLDILRARGIL